MEWTNDFTLCFLELYKQEPCLWDPSNPCYKRKEKIFNAWQRLSECTGKPVTELKRKKDSLMATFRGLLRKQKASIKNGAEGSFVYQPVWFAFHLMESFLGEVYGINSQFVMNSIDNDQLDTTDLKAEDGDCTQLIPSMPSPPMDRPASPSCQSTVRRRKYPTELRESEKVFGLFKQSRYEEEDECDLYARMLAKKLRKLPGWERQLVMHEIDGMVLNAMHRSRCFGSSSSTSSLPHSNKQPSNFPTFDSFSSHEQSSHDQPNQQHAEDLEIDSKADIVTFEDNEPLS